MFMGRYAAKLIMTAVVAGIASMSQAQAVECGGSYTVRAGDSLTKLAIATWGDADAFSEIHRLNAATIGQNPNNLHVGMMIELPCPPAGYMGADLTSETTEEAEDTPKQALPRTPWKVLTTPDELIEMHQQWDVQVLDIRSAPLLVSGTIPGALWIPFGQFSGPFDTPDVPPASVLSTLVGNVGLKLDRPIAIVSQGGETDQMGRAAYVYWLLKSAGAERVAILKGGMTAWYWANEPLTLGPSAGASYDADLTYSDAWWAKESELDAVVAAPDLGALLYVQDKPVAQGAVGPGTPLSLERFARVRNRELDIDASVNAVFENLRVQNVELGDDLVITVASSSLVSALTWYIAAEVAGIPNVKHFPGFEPVSKLNPTLASHTGWGRP